jgi:hypothetical protein
MRAGWLAIGVLWASAGFGNVGEDSVAVTDSRNEGHEKSEAAEKVAEARRLRQSLGEEFADREKVVGLYKAAIDLQPEAKINMRLCDEVAQVYAFTTDREGRFKPDPAKAAEWWRRCIRLSDTSQLVWSQARMGLASMAVMRGDWKGALAEYDAVLGVDVEGLKRPAWRPEKEPETDDERRTAEAEIERIRAQGRNLQLKCVDLYLYVAEKQHAGEPGLVTETMRGLARKHEGSPVGDRASDLAEKAAGAPRQAPTGPAPAFPK